MRPDLYRAHPGPFHHRDPRLLRAALACFALSLLPLWAFLVANGCTTAKPVTRDTFLYRFEKGVTGTSNGPAVRWPTPLLAMRLPFGSWTPGTFVIREDRIGFGYRYTLHPVTRELPDGTWEQQGRANPRPDAVRLTPENYVGVAYPLDAK